MQDPYNYIKITVLLKQVTEFNSFFITESWHYPGTLENLATL